MIWDRARTERIFGLAHRLEAYVPAPKRVYGYFAMPVLAGGRIVARVDPVRRDGVLVGQTVTVRAPLARSHRLREPWSRPPRWVGCDGRHRGAGCAARIRRTAASGPDRGDASHVSANSPVATSTTAPPAATSAWNDRYSPPIPDATP